MPGTVQVIVLEFKGVPSSSTPSAKSLKVSMGKMHYQTWDGGEFSFPITKLREDLVVALLDASGNEIAHAEIRAMEIIEKGFWDEVFSISDIGNVHMKLQFTLNEVERNRIRVMREYAIKKKLEANPSINLKLSETTASTGDSVETSTEERKGAARPKVEASQAGSSMSSITYSTLPISGKQRNRGTIKSAIQVKELSLDTSDRSRSAPSSPGKHRGKKFSPVEHRRVPADKIETQANTKMDIEKKDSQKFPNKKFSVSSERENDSIQESKHEGHEEKAPSSVRKMISAFENSRLQGVALMGSKQERRSIRKSLSVPSQLNRFRNKESNIFTGDSSETPLMELEEANGDRTSQTASGTVRSPGRMPKDQFQVTESSELSSQLLHSYESSAAEKSGRGRGSALKSSAVIIVQEALNMKPGSLQSYREEIFTVDSSKPPPNELEETEVNLIRQSASGSTISSGKMTEEQSQVTEAFQLSSKLLHSSESSAAEESGVGKESVVKSSTVNIVQEALNMKSKSLQSYTEDILAVDSVETPQKGLEEINLDLMRQSNSGTAMNSRRMPEQFRVSEASQLTSKLLDSYESSAAEVSGSGSGSGSGSILKSSTMIVIQEALNMKPRSLESDSGQSSGMWIFPGNTRCITTAGEQTMEIFGHHRKESKDYHRKKISSQASGLETNLMPRTENNMEGNLRITGDVSELASGSSSDNSSSGIFGQVIKIAVILGFGALVLLTRQKDPLKKSNQEKVDLFPRSDYFDERLSKPW